ncbi:VanZ family protein [Lacticaseibacillus suihuaensis]
MSAYVFPLKMAALTFPVIALLIALPFLLGQYRRYGSLIAWRAVVVYTFIFYLLAAYFLVILPLPDRASVAALTTPRYSLVPFHELAEFLAATPFVWNQPATWLATVKESTFFMPLFNVALTLPFGVYLRYYFKRPVWQVVIASFTLSLFFELTQLSGLYGYYPRPYRLFEVDDLILNTLGGTLGGLLAPTLMRVFPSRDEMDQAAIQKGRRVTWTRRLVAMLIDNLIVASLLGALAHLLLQLLGVSSDLTLFGNVAGMLLTFGLAPLLMNGQTPGKRAVRIRIVRADGSPASIWRVWWREFLLYGAAFNVMRAFQWVFEQIFSKFHRTETNFILLGLLAIPVVFLVANFLWEVVTRDNRYFYDVWADTTQISTVQDATLTDPAAPDGTTTDDDRPAPRPR